MNFFSRFFRNAVVAASAFDKQSRERRVQNRSEHRAVLKRLGVFGDRMRKKFPGHKYCAWAHCGGGHGNK